MFDKYLCKHIQKKTILLGDVADLVGEYCFLGFLLLIGSFCMGMAIYESCGYDTSISYARHVLNCVTAGLSVIAAFGVLCYTISCARKIEVAHCPTGKKEN